MIFRWICLNWIILINMFLIERYLNVILIVKKYKITTALNHLQNKINIFLLCVMCVCSSWSIWFCILFIKPKSFFSPSHLIQYNCLRNAKVCLTLNDLSGMDVNRKCFSKSGHVQAMLVLNILKAVFYLTVV